MAITDKINNNLKTLFNIDDPVYKSLICDRNGTIPSTISKPTDIDIGAIASQIEYLRLLSITLIKQLYLDEAASEFLKYQLNEFFNSLQFEDESDAEWVQRTIATVFQQKVSRAAIIYWLRPYSSLEPEISNVLTSSAFAGFCFAGRYDAGTYTMPDGTIIVYVPALAGSYDSSCYTIKITLYDTASVDIWTVQNILRKIIAAGITYYLEIKST